MDRICENLPIMTYVRTYMQCMAHYESSVDITSYSYTVSIRM